MNRKPKIYITVLSTIFLSLLSIPVYAQAPTVITAEVDRSTLTTDEVLILSVTIATGSAAASEPRLPALDGFDLVATSTSTQLSIINGVMKSEKVFHYTLHPSAAGEMTIGPILTDQNDQAYQTAPIKVSVSQGTGQRQSPPQPAAPGFTSLPSIAGFPSLSGLLQSFGLDNQPDIQGPVEPLDSAKLPSELRENEYLVEAEVDNASPYLGEQVVYTFRYYRPASATGRSIYEPPEFSGFWVHPETSETQFGGQFAGRKIHMTEIQTILTPTILGEVEIDPAKITSEGDIFSRGFTIQTRSETVSVQPLPEGAPQDFSGAVGNFNIAAQVDLEQAKVNDAVTLTVTISGEGNLETFTDPQWEVRPQWRAFDSQASTDIQVEAGTIIGTRTIKQVLIPTTDGELTLPSIEFSYFDPQAGTYQTARTEPFSIFVEPDGQAPAPVSIEEQHSQAGTTGSLLPIKNTPDTDFFPSSLINKPGFWLLWLLPVVLIFSHFSWQKRRENILDNQGTRRGRKAAKKAYQALKKKNPESGGYFNAVGHILIDYLSDKLDRSVSGLTQAEISGLLLAHGVDHDLVKQVRTCKTISEVAQYAPIHDVNTGQFHQEIKSLIAELDKVL